MAVHGSATRSRRAATVFAVLATALLGVVPAVPAAAGTGSSTARASEVCGDPAPAKLLLASPDAGADAASRRPAPAPAVERAVADYKAAHDVEGLAQRAGNAEAAAAHAAAKAAAAPAPAPSAITALSSDAALRACAGGGPLGVTPDTSGPGYAWVDYLNQQGQVTSYYCGPATVSELAWTVPGPSGVDQWTAGSWMGTTTDGTSVDQEVNGLNHFVGVPDFGWNFYGYVWMDYNPTPAQRSAFLSNLQSDVSVSSPVAGNAWEVAGGPHLIGHPAGQTIFHWFEIGGWSTNTSQVYYADSATTVWSSVPAYSWQDTYTVETIMGGRGYAW